MHSFLKKDKNSIWVKLRKELYSKAMIKKVQEQEPEIVCSVRAKGEYFFVELKTADKEDCFDFLNCLVYCRRNA
jgi:hypothetical protein